MTSPEPNSRDVAATTPGISRNMNLVELFGVEPQRGGGNLNGTQATVLFAQAGTGADRIALPRAGPGSCGIV